MNSKIKNILIFVGVAIALIAAYFLFFKKDTNDAGLVVANGSSVVDQSGQIQPANTIENNSSTNQDFLSVLLNIQSIKLNDKIFSEKAFQILRDSSISISPDGTEGRANPFAPIGSDIVVVPTVETPDLLLNTIPEIDTNISDVNIKTDEAVLDETTIEKDSSLKITPKTETKTLNKVKTID